MKVSKDNVVFYAIIVFLILLGFYFVNTFSYFDPVRWCYIGISGDPVSGNEDTIHSALKQIKKTDKEEYKTVCKYVERINEKYCMGADPRGGEEGFMGWEEAGCYIKGSKVIYIKPERGETDSIINTRAETIKKYANYSQAFWLNNK